MDRMVLWGMVFVLILFLTVGWGIQNMFTMPGKSVSGALPALTVSQKRLKERLRQHVQVLGSRIGERNLLNKPEALSRAADYVEARFREYGYVPREQTYRVSDQSVRNIYVHGGSLDSSLIILGAHYDTVSGSPGANDNGSGVAALLELARALRDVSSECTLVFVAFVNEEPPYFTTRDMGSYRFAEWLAEQDREVQLMISLETIGYYSNEPGSQQYPPLVSYFYPSRGNFVGFVGNVWYGDAVRRSIRAFREHAEFPSEGIAAPSFIPGIAWSDHRSFWQHGFPALMVTDTALYRYPYYHTPRDTPDKLNYDGFTRVVDGLEALVRTRARVR